MSAPETVSAAPKKRKKSRKSGPVGKLMFLLICMVLAILLKAAFMFVVIGMLPTVAARYAGDSDDGELYRSVLACNIAGILPHGVELYQSGSAALMNFNSLSNANLWLSVYGMASLGYVLIWTCPRLVLAFTELSNSARIGRVENAQKQLVDEWGSAIARQEAKAG